MKPQRYVASFDSASAFMRALAAALRGEDFRGLGTLRLPSPGLRALHRATNALPEPLRKELYIWGGWREAIPPGRIDEVDAEQMAAWVTKHYPRRRYPAVMIGSSNGAAMHLCATLGIPWVPQTLLVPVRRPRSDPDDSKAGMQAGIDAGRRLLERNEDLQLHHMHDANQDRLMIQRMTYFRVKRLRLGPTLRGWLRDSLEPGGTVFLLDCELRWPVTRVGDRHYFQHGAFGGATVDEIMHGGPRVGEFLETHGSAVRRWSPPSLDAEAPESEWGFARELGTDTQDLCRSEGFELRRIGFKEPGHLSAMVAELHDRWYERRGLERGGLLVESFILVEPWWAPRTGFVPYWTVFGTEPSALALERFLDAHEQAEVGALLFSHGIDSIGLAPSERWQALVGRARKRGKLVGVDPGRFPRDFGVFFGYWPALQRFAAPRADPPAPLRLEELDDFLAGRTWEGVSIQTVD